MNVVVAVTAASGALYARLLLRTPPACPGVERIALVCSARAGEVAAWEGVELPGVRTHRALRQRRPLRLARQRLGPVACDGRRALLGRHGGPHRRRGVADAAGSVRPM